MAESLSRRDGAALLALARAAIRDAVDADAAKRGPTAVDGVLQRVDIGPALDAPRGVFVTLRTPVAGQPRGDLRGCIGTLAASLPLYRNVIATAPRSALEDPRFPALTSDEVDAQSIEVSALTPLRPVASIDEIVVGRDGVQLAAKGHRAVFLPQVAAEQCWTVEEFVRRLALKAGLPSDAWREAALQTFQAEVFEESDPPNP